MTRKQLDAREAAAFQREKRYIVIKLKDLSEDQAARLTLAMSGFTGSSRYVEEIPTRECVVVESDWPEYETVWAMIKARCVGEAHLRSTSPAGEVGEMIERLRKAAKPGVGAAADWSDRECADYWSHIAVTGRTLHAKAAAMLERLAGSDTERNTDYNLGFDDGLAVGKAASDTEAMRLLADIRHRAHMIELVEQGCGGNLTFKEMAESAMRQAKEIVARIDALAKGGAA